MVFIPFFLYIGHAKDFFWGSVFVIVITLPITGHLVYYGLESLKMGSLKDAIQTIFTNVVFQIVGLSVFNIWIFLRIGLQTLIILQTYLLIFSVAILIGFLSAHFGMHLRKKTQKFLYALGIAPFVINLFLVLNFIGSSNPTQETYQFFQETRYMNRYARPEFYSKKSSRIFLQGEGARKYGNYLGIQIFWNYTEMLNSDTIMYTFEEGLLGIRVITVYEFIPYPIQKNR